MDISRRSIIFLMLCGFSNSVRTEDPEEKEDSEDLENVSRARSMNKDIMEEIDMTFPGKTFPGCGFRSPKVRRTRDIPDLPMIYGGKEAEPHSWPWMVQVHRGGSFCGGSLISQTYVLTVAHCVVQNGTVSPAKEVSVHLGAHTGSGGTKYPVKNVISHPRYKPTPGMQNDIALIEVGRRVKLSKKVHPVCLPSIELKNKIKKDNSNVTATGWGDAEEGKANNVLREVTINIVPWKKCKDVKPSLIKEQVICAGVVKSGKGICLGDSGGPLVYKLKDNSYVQLGVASFVINGCGSGDPDAYTRVSSYMKWIFDNTDLGK